MKFKNIAFNTIGPFNNASLIFPNEKSLNVIYGENERGKSCALRYFSFFLFGIPNQSPDNFSHAYKNFSIQADLITKENSKAITLIRKKGQSPSLFYSDGNNAEPFLLKILGSLSSEKYFNLFGLNHHLLRKGAEHLLGGEGNWDQSLFEAGPGLFNLKKIEELLEKKLEETKKTLKTLGDEAKELTEKMDGQEVTYQAYNTLFSEKEDLEKNAKTLKHGFQQGKKKEEELQSLLRAYTDAGNRKNRLARLQSLTSIPYLTELDLQKYKYAFSSFQITNTELETLTKQRDALKTRRGEIVLDEAILREGNIILRINQEIGELATLQKLLPEKINKGSVFNSLANQKAKELSNNSLEEVISLFPTLVDKAEIQDLLKRKENSKVQFQNKKSEETSLCAEVEEKQEEWEKAQPNPAAEQVEFILAAIQKENLFPDTLNARKNSLGKNNHGLAEKFSGLHPWTGTPEKLLELPLPSGELLKQFQKDFLESQNLISSIDDNILSRSRVVKEKDDEMQSLELQGKIPSKEELGNARQARAQAWQAFDSNSTLASMDHSLVPGGLDPKAAFLFLLERADHLADTMLAAGENLGRITQLRQDASNLRLVIESLESDKKNAVLKQNALELKWRNLWLELQIQNPNPPAAMELWLQKVQAWKIDFQNYKPEKDALESDYQRFNKLITQGLSLPPFTGLQGSLSIEPLRTFFHNEQEKKVRRVEIKKQLDATKTKLLACQKDLERLEKENAKDLLDLTTQLERLRLPKESCSNTVAQYFETIGQIRQSLLDAKREENSAREIEDKLARKEAVYVGLLGNLQLNWPSQHADIQPGIEKLNSRLEAAKRGKENHAQWDQQIQDQEQQIQEKESRLSADEGTLKALSLQLPGKPTPLQLGEYFEQIREKAEHESMRKEIEGRLSIEAKGKDLDAFCAELENADPTNLQNEISSLEQTLQENDEKIVSLNRSIGEKTVELQNLEKNDAPELENKIDLLKTECYHLAREHQRYALLKIILRKTIEEYLNKNKNPLLEGAEKYFKKMTRGRYSTIVPEKAGEKRVLKVSDTTNNSIGFDLEDLNPEEKKGSPLSDGTADQLFLSFRLAAIENNIKDLKETVPVVLDDILIQFDDDRAAAALDCLAELSEHCQIILFTHHKHLEKVIQNCDLKEKISFQELQDVRQ